MGIDGTLRAAGAVALLLGIAGMSRSTATDAHGAYTLLDETADDTFNVTFTLTASPPGRAGAEAQFAFNILDDTHHYYARLHDGEASFLKVNGAKPAPIGAGGALPESDGTWELTLQRRGARMTLLCNGRRVAMAGDAEFRRGRLGSRATGDGITITDVSYQVVAPPQMSDDFMREGDAGGGWEPVAGTWQNAGPKGPKPTPEYSANPFSYRSSAPGRYGLAVAGYWFWDAYEARAAVRPMDDGAVGLCVYYQDPENYYLFRWVGIGGGQGRRQLLRVRDGQGVPIAQADGGYDIGQWYVLAARVFDGRLQGLIDGEVVLEAYDESFGEGAIGLYVAGCREAYFDDVRVQSFDGLADGFEPPSEGRWTQLAGQWKLDQQHFYGQPRAARRGAAGKLAAAVSTYGDWSDFTFGATVKPKTASAVGLRFGCRDDANYHLFRWAGGKAGQQELVRVRDGEPTLLASRPGAYQGDRMYRLSVRADDGYILAAIDGDPVLEAVDAEARGGRVGLQAEGAGPACFDDIAVLPRLRDPHLGKIQRQFAREDTMTMWTLEAAEWRRDDGAYWYRTPLFADHAISLQLPPLRARDGALQVFLGADGKRVESGSVLTLEKKHIAAPMAARLQQAGQVVKTAVAPATEGKQTIKLQRKGSWIVASIDGRALLSYQAAGPHSGYFAGYKSDGLDVEKGSPRVTSPNLHDYTFSCAPTDWRPQQGVWEVADRWGCEPGWAWFRGSGHRSPIIWSKARYRGDLELRFWCAFQHPYQDNGPSNLNATICGDGANLCSGYNFIFAGDGNAASKILRGTAEVIKNSGVRRPDKNTYHRHWFDVQIRRIGRKITYHVDGKRVGEYDDPRPLDGGHIAFWSYDGNGIVIARARLSFEERVP
ncbi:MAG: hypothetical protein PVH68_08020 [Armatimonadota bacterium]|jgi:hypothetical protein